jgi:hypothetical protein
MAALDPNVSALYLQGTPGQMGVEGAPSRCKKSREEKQRHCDIICCPAPEKLVEMHVPGRTEAKVCMETLSF